MIKNTDDVQAIYHSKYYKADNIESTETNIYTFDISFKKECITDGLVCRKYENNIVYHEQFAISKQHRQQGHARKIHRLECKAYKANGISKIVLNATRDGICVWGRLGFNIIDEKYHNILLDLFRDYLIDVVFPENINNAKVLFQQCKNIKKLFSNDFKKYILPENKQSFTEYLYDDNRLIGTIKMEKELYNE